MLIKEIKRHFQSASNPLVAEKQKAYMRNQFAFLGLTTPERRLLQKALFQAKRIQGEKELYRMLVELWSLEEREYQYCAMDLVRYHLKWLSVDSLEICEKMIRQKSWWDTVDDLAINMVGKLLGQDFKQMDRWIQDPNLWIRRSAIISQIKRKKETDATRLFTYCEQTAHEKEFFIRKAIGWALREYSKHHPQAVRQFLEISKDKLSGLSIREASKYL